MNDRRYLLSIKELLEGSVKQSAEHLEEWACAKLDRERLRKLEGITARRKRAECIGAGLLIQLGLQESGSNVKSMDEDDVVLDVVSKSHIQLLTVSQLLAKLEEPIEPEYTYSEKGKPYFKNISLYFNLSHSGEYVFCAFSGQEVGADIQYKKPGCNERIVRRFFTEAEQYAWDACKTSEKEALFYKIWTRKEAYGKLTGEGLVAALAVNVLPDSLAAEVVSCVSGNSGNAEQADTTGICWEEYEMFDDYQITVCKQAEGKGVVFQ